MAEGVVIVVLFGSRQDGRSRVCELSHCPMAAYAFASGDLADAFIAEQPAWTQPHKLYGEYVDSRTV